MCLSASIPWPEVGGDLVATSPWVGVCRCRRESSLSVPSFVSAICSTHRSLALSRPTACLDAFVVNVACLTVVLPAVPPLVILAVHLDIASLM